MTRYRTTSALAVLAAACALALAACGGGGSSSADPAPAGSAATVSLETVDGVGDVLVDSSGNALYSPDQEAGGKVLCTGACASIWVPLTVTAGMQPTGSAGVDGQLALVERPDGARQVTYKGKPLYTFSEDASPGDVRGNGVADDFGGTSFTWHVAAPGPVSAGTSTEGGYRY